MIMFEGKRISESEILIKERCEIIKLKWQYEFLSEKWSEYESIDLELIIKLEKLGFDKYGEMRRWKR